jgi:hypothetical protein
VHEECKRELARLDEKEIARRERAARREPGGLSPSDERYGQAAHESWVAHNLDPAKTAAEAAAEAARAKLYETGAIAATPNCKAEHGE